MSIRKRIEEIGKYGSIYMASWISNSVVSLALLPVFTRYLDPKEYGTVSILDSTTNLLRIICALGLGSAIIRFYNEYKSSNDRNKVVSTGILSTILLAILVGIILCLFRRKLTLIVLGGNAPIIYMSLSIATMLFALLRSASDSYLVAQKAAILFVAANTGQVILSSGINLYLVIVADMGIIGILTGNLIASAIVNIILLSTILKKISLDFDLTLLKKMLKFSTPMVVAILSAAGMHELDRFFLRYYTSMNEVGLYSLAYKFPFMLTTMFAGSFERIWGGSMLYEIANDSDATFQYARISTYYMTLFGFALLCLSLGAKTVVRILAASEYASSATYIPVISLGVWLYAFHMFSRVGVLLTKKTYLFSINYLLALVTNIILNFLLVPYFGAMGAAISTVVTYGYFSLGGFFLIYRKCYGMKFEWGKLSFVAVGSISLVLIRNLIHTEAFLETLVIDLAFITLFSILLLISPRFLTKEERNFIYSALQQTFSSIAVFCRGLQK